MSVDMRNIVLKSCFNSRLGRGFNFAHLNPGSLVSNFTEFTCIVKDVPLHLIAISETWLKEKHSDIQMNLDGYNIIRKDRIDNRNRRGGGVAIFIKKNLSYKLIKKSSLASSFDFIFIEISNTHNAKVLVGVVYRPPNIKFGSKFRKFLTDSASKYSNILILGDLNLEVNSNKKYVRTFKDFIFSLDLEIASYCPTNFVDSSATCLDLLLLNNRPKLNFFTQISVPGLFTTHDMIFGSYNFDINIYDEDAYTYRRSLNLIDQNALLTEANSLDWRVISTFPNINDQLGRFNALVSHLLEKYAPLRKVSLKSPGNSFSLNHSILNHRNIRDFLHEIWRANKNPISFSHYKKYRNKVNEMIKAAKLQYFKSNIFNLDLPNKILWRNFQKYDDIQSEAQGSNGNPIGLIRFLLPLISTVLTNIINTVHTSLLI